MKKVISFVLLSFFAFIIFCVVSCSEGKDVDEAKQHLVINELMASNRTGLLSPNNKISDWIEIKNTGKDSIDLEGFQICLIKHPSDDPKDNEDKDSVKTWTFPSVNIRGGECMIVFAEKNKDSAKEAKGSSKNDVKSKKNTLTQSLTADFKLPKDGATLQLLTPKGNLITEVKYEALAPDHSFALNPDNTYKATYWQSPGFENTREGYVSFMEKMEDQRNSALLIWEVMSRSPNSSSNWVELKNVSDSEIELSDYCLSKKMGKTEEWKLPSRKLKPGELITIQLAGSKGNPYNPLHSTVKLGNSETLVLSRKGKFADGVCAKSTPYGGSIGRKEGEKGFFFFSHPSKNSENGNEGKRYIAEKPRFNHKPGLYSKNDTLCLRLAGAMTPVHYTLDGSEPTMNSPIFKDSILITKSTVVRTFAEGDSTNLKSGIATSTFLTGVSHEIPVLNISVNKADLYDHNRGIYAKGPGYTEEWPHLGANFWKNWTKKAHVEFFDGDDGFSADCGLKIFGGFSRYEDKKSFRVKFKGEYGQKEVSYDFFGEGRPMELEDLVIRSGAQDFNRCMLRDEFFTSLMQPTSPALLTQKYRPVALYVNAEYFGLYYLREKIDRDFVARKLNIPNDSISIIVARGYVEEGSPAHFNHLMQYVGSRDMSSKDNYEYVKSHIDLEGLIDQKIGEIYSGNSDVGNVRYARSTSPKSDKKWHYIFYDLDASWVGYKPTADYYLSTGGVAAESNVAYHNKMINGLLKNHEFRALFLERLSHHLTNTFSKENATSVFDNLVAQIRPEMKNNCKRWPKLSYEQWEKNISDFRSKFEEKPKVMLNDLRKYLSITEAENKKYFSHLGY